MSAKISLLKIYRQMGSAFIEQGTNEREYCVCV